MSDENKEVSDQNNASTEQGADNPSGGFDFNTVIAQAKQVITDPVTFYRNMAKSGGFSEPLIFVLVMGAITGAVIGVLSVIGLTGAGAAGLGAIIVVPIALLIGSFISAAIIFVIWKLMGSAEGYQTAYRCMAYSTAILPIVSIFSIIPYLGTVVRTVWGIWLVIIASTEVHQRKEQSAKMVFGILGAIALLVSLSSEYTQRNIQDELETQAQQLEDRFKALEKMGVGEDGEVDPEQMGRAFGEFMKGMEDAKKGADSTAGEDDSN